MCVWWWAGEGLLGMQEGEQGRLGPRESNTLARWGLSEMGGIQRDNPLPGAFPVGLSTQQSVPLGRITVAPPKRPAVGSLEGGRTIS